MLPERAMSSEKRGAVMGEEPMGALEKQRPPETLDALSEWASLMGSDLFLLSSRASSGARD